MESPGYIVAVSAGSDSTCEVTSHTSDAAAALATSITGCQDALSALKGLSELCLVANLGDWSSSVANSGCLTAVVDALCRWEDDPAVAAAACRAVFFLARSDANKTAATLDLFRALSRALERFSLVESVAAAACDALANLAALPGVNHALMVGAGVVPLVKSALQHHGGSALVVEASCAALMNLADAPCTHAAMADVGVVSALVSTLQGPMSSSDVITEFACGALRNIAADAAGSKVMTGAPGAVPALLAALSTHSSQRWSPLVLEAACEALLNIVDAEGRHAPSIDPSAALPLLVRIATAAHERRDGPSLSLTMALIAKIVDWGKGNGAPEHCGCIPLAARLVIVLKGQPPQAEPTSPDTGTLIRASQLPVPELGYAIEEAALTSLWFLFRADANEEAAAAISPTLVPALCDILVRPGTPRRNVLLTCCVFRNLCACLPIARIAEFASDPVSAVTRIIIANATTDVGIFTEAGHALNNLIYDNETPYWRRIYEAGLPRALIYALALHSTNVDCVEIIAKLFGLLVDDDAIYAELRRLGVVSLLIEVLQAGMQRDAFAAHLCNALWWVLRRRSSAARRAVSPTSASEVAPAVDAIVATLAAHEGCEAVEFSACGALAAVFEGVIGSEVASLASFDAVTPLALAVMRRRAGTPGPISSKIVDRAAAILSSMSEEEPRCRRIVELGAVPVLISACQTHGSPRNPNCVLFIAATLNRITICASTRPALAGVAGLSPLLVPALSAHKADENVTVQVGGG